MTTTYAISNETGKYRIQEIPDGAGGFQTKLEAAEYMHCQAHRDYDKALSSIRYAVKIVREERAKVATHDTN